MTTYILITLVLTFVNNFNITGGGANVVYQITKSKSVLADGLKSCQDDSKCQINALIVCDFSGCKQKDYVLKTSPTINNDVDISDRLDEGHMFLSTSLRNN